MVAAGFAERDLRVYTSQQILDSWERFQAERSLAQRVAGAVTDDPETIEQYFGYARQGRAALWVHVPDDDDADRAVRGLADHQVPHSATTATTAKTTSTSAEASTRPEKRRQP